ncbi:unnamed protein product [Paramecium pentaurelia]|uniref:Uncharacterized protein n=1 Tax=Paramecium pentaurelia TaxID=43138 RepID=A0A8S1SL04_9CILI|nr:unnamed protein product [Paramecium pentaurelia]
MGNICAILYQKLKQKIITQKYQSQNDGSDLQTFKFSIQDSTEFRQALKSFQKVQIMYKENKYFSDDQLKRITQDIEGFIKPDAISNLEQIKYLSWSGKYDNMNQKIGKWIVKWKDEALNDVGGQYSNNKKQGIWKDIFKNYIIKSQVYEVGEYACETRQHFWKMIYKDEEIGGGEYNLKGQKTGKWIELSDGYSYDSQVMYFGEYKDNKKVGIWDILFRKNNETKFKLIGCGSYSEGGNGIKIGKWVEQSEGFYADSQITYQGEYKNGKKDGRWDIFFMNNNQNELIGGGSYGEEDGAAIKVGEWTELDSGFENRKQVLVQGVYQQEKKVGEWSILYRKGGGFYDKRSLGIKIGKWVEQSEGFYADSQITYQGEYKIGKKDGRWDIFFMNNNQDELIGGGSYGEEDGAAIKVGEWTELDSGFENRKQVLVQGVYQQEKKIGEWSILYRKGGGFYDERGSGIKIGKWVEQSEDFYADSQIKYHGEYKNGKKVGRWDIWYEDEWGFVKKIGGGSYDEVGEGIKFGQWIELINDFDDSKQITQKGEYKNGKKVGIWDDYDLQENDPFQSVRKNQWIRDEK